MIYGVSFSENLADKLALDLLERTKDNPLDLANTCVILPTKRACLIVKKAFMSLANRNNLLLPRLMALYELDNLDLEIPPALSSLDRILLLTKLCLAKPNILDYTQALKMALSLCELLDVSYQFDVDLSKLNQLSLPERFSMHWQETVQFLDILHEHWPKILREQGKIDPMDRSIRLIRSFTQKLKQNSQASIVMAGFTDVFPALTELIEVVSQQKGNLILMDNYIGDNPNIPYYTDLHRPQEAAAIEAFSKDSWEPSKLPQKTFENVQLINANTPAEEALTIALLLRETLETPDQTATLVTTDRTLARQVISQMKRWNIQLDDSAGAPLNHTEIGIFFALIADLGLHPSATNYLALLKHPLSADGQYPTDLRAEVQKQEKYLRDNHQNGPFQLNTDLQPWIAMFQERHSLPFIDLLKKHIEIAEKLAKSSDKSATERLWQTEPGQQLFGLFVELLEKGSEIGEIEPSTYPEILKMFLQQISIRPKYGMHPRLNILGPIEARFHHADVCIIGGLNEGIFPPLPETGPWLNRPMRQALGLPAPEEKTHELAMDFAHNFCAAKVYLTRSLKKDGAQAIPSRFIERLKAVAEINNLKFPEYQAHLPILIDQPNHYDTPVRPMPCPPSSQRPKKLPVTQIEMWRRNPYAIYARYILNLYPLEEIDPSKHNAEFGTLIHQTIAKFLSEHPKSTDKKLLLDIGNGIFENSSLPIMDKFLLKIKFDAIADFIIQQQIQDLSTVTKSQFEQELRHTFDVNGQSFELTGTADRIDWLTDNSLRIIDYKTYQPPSQKEVKAGYAPQLLLEALLLQETQQAPISTLAYWYLSNKKEASCVYPIVASVKEMAELIRQTKEGLFQMISAFQSEKTPYEVCPIPSQSPKFNDYAHLARMQEWTSISTGDTP